MGDNKKKKVDFSTALQAQAKKLAPKFDPADEEFIANINGEDVKFVRGDSTDEEWEAIKKAPSMAQRVTVVPDPSGGSPASRAVAVRKKGESDADWKARAAQFENHPRYEARSIRPRPTSAPRSASSTRCSFRIRRTRAVKARSSRRTS